MKSKNNTANKTTKSNKPILIKRTAADKVCQEMAVYFEGHITASNLVRWITTVSQTKRLLPCGEIDDFIFNIGWSFLPELINCKDEKTRIEFLESSLTGVFSNCGYIGSKTAICEIGRNYLNEFETLSNDTEEVGDFMKVYSAFLCLRNLFEEYKTLSDEETEPLKAA